MQLSDVGALATSLAGVRETAPGGLVQWRYHGRLVARQLDAAQIVIRADFDYRDALLRQWPDIFTVPRRFAAHMMVVVDLERACPEVIEDALVAAWDLQRRAG